ncbi:MAG: dockerin type I repeat-containing protein, partial [Planctomycetota bacterium]
AKITCSSCVPDNDTCAGAQAITAGSFAFGNTGAGGNTTVNCGTGTLYNDVWFTYGSSAYGQCTISTCNNANFDTMIAVFTGSCASGFSLVACNDDGAGCANYTSSVSFNTLCGVQYTVVVGGWSPTARGTGILSVSQGGTCLPPNDACAGATPLQAGPNLVSNFGAGGAMLFPCGAGTLHNDVWYTYTATTSGDTTVSTCNTANFDTMIGVYTGSCATGLSLVACNDDTAFCGLTSRVTFSAQCGTVYRIALGGYSTTAAGSGTLTVTPGSTSCCPGDLNGDGTRNAQDLAALLGAWGSSNPAADLNSDGIVNAQDLAALLGGWGPC